MPPTLPNTLLIISLKMYFAPSRTLSYLRGLLELNANSNNPNKKDLLLALIPDFLTIHPCAEILREANATDSFLLGAQDCFWEALGPYTGEVSPLALRDLGVSIVELGHAERRAIFHETDDEVAKKAKAACEYGLIPLVCVGEITAPAGDQAKAIARAIEEVAVQIRPVLGAIPADAPVIFAYEPVWAIGKPVPAGVDHVSAVVEGIRDVVRESGGSGRQGEVRVLYGGSAGPGLWGAGGLGKSVDGMFLGRFAHEIDGVRKVVQEVEETPQ
ncbi:triose-phosphate isomerase [Aspergillus chevalieri]|uniref:Triosephosphate isomerase n=1 Tax=Aspergillus chevalieri TaxID=182096 RepID=A0A7R7VNX3_ASPCH|nr:uncharacterized protein ACHE_40613A [Aspergillus chevalieri]BCR88049.1 hypothetical protein ACHE_40613A [Aspergillus chevalieri]